MNLGQRVKSVTLADFKPDEISALEEGGNEVRLVVEPTQTWQTPSSVGAAHTATP
jgi:hypothetical protein